MKEYSIREIKYLHNLEDNIVYCPQVERTEEITTGYLWWKKTKTIKRTELFFRWDKELFTEEFKPFKENFIYCSTKEEAQKIIDEYKLKIDKVIRKLIITSKL